jgi:hypothetical protein
MGRTLAATLFALVTASAVAAAQSRPDFTGLWISPTADISVVLLPGEEISLTPYGGERYRKVDMANSPSYKCLPYGPTRGLQSSNPFQIIQPPDLFAIITEHIDYRMIYTDGRGHPQDILDYPEWMGHSIGRWQGDTLVVETIGMREETWLDTAGFEHGDKLRITERFQKTGPDTIRVTVTIDDPVFYTKPFTYGRNVRRTYWSVAADPLKTLRPSASVKVPPYALGNPFLAGDELVTVTASPMVRSSFLQPFL